MTSVTTSYSFKWLKLNIRFHKWNAEMQQLVSSLNGVHGENHRLEFPGGLTISSNATFLSMTT